MNNTAEAPEALAPTDPEIEAALKDLPPEFYDQTQDVRSIDLALIHAKGDVMKAAQVATIELKELKQKVRRSKYLRARWVKEPPAKVTKAVPPHVPTAAELTENLDAATAAYQEQLRTITNDDNQADQINNTVHKSLP